MCARHLWPQHPCARNGKMPYRCWDLILPASTSGFDPSDPSPLCPITGSRAQGSTTRQGKVSFRLQLQSSLASSPQPQRQAVLDSPSPPKPSPPSSTASQPRQAKVSPSKVHHNTFAQHSEARGGRRRVYPKPLANQP